jgi:anion-transporting  ArsA/GET3 family ATPase
MKTPLDLKDHRLVICLGPGGVGKTTISAALALYGTLEGRSVDVMTVDPAPRLLDALGLDASSAEPQRVPLDGLLDSNIGKNGRRARPRLRALKLDPKATFDALVDRYAPSAQARDTILENRIYRNLSDALSGVGDYMAMEKLLELHLAPDADLIVLDTPPASEAIDFLDAPRRLLDLLNSRAITLLGRSGGSLLRGLKMVDFAARTVLSAFDRVTGLHLLGDVQGFVESFAGMYAGFAERAQKAGALLHSGETFIVIVTTAEAARITQAREFAAALDAAGLHVDAVVVNRMMPEIPDSAEIARAKISPSLKRKLARNLKDFQALKHRETDALKDLRGGLSSKSVILAAPDLGREPRTLADLAEIARSLEVIGPDH